MLGEGGGLILCTQNQMFFWAHAIFPTDHVVHIRNLVFEGIPKETFKIIQNRTCSFILKLGWKDWGGVGKGFCANSF